MKRNGKGPDGKNYTPRKLTNHTRDDGQKITSLPISKVSIWVVFVGGRGAGSVQFAVCVAVFGCELSAVFGGEAVEHLAVFQTKIFLPRMHDSWKEAAPK